jgi:hypothetical protein
MNKPVAKTEAFKVFRHHDIDQCVVDSTFGIVIFWFELCSYMPELVFYVKPKRDVTENHTESETFDVFGDVLSEAIISFEKDVSGADFFHFMPPVYN